MKLRGIPDETIRLVTYSHAIQAFGASGQLAETDWTRGAAIDQSQKFEGNTILRGGQQPRIDKSSMIIR
jgi:hypothetical protein